MTRRTAAAMPTEWPQLSGPGPEFVVDLDRFDANAAVLAGRAAGLPIRVATKSVRVRGLIERVLTLPGFSGLLCYSLGEALWLAEQGHRDLLVAYPSVDRSSLARLARHEWRASQITVMVDSVAHLDLIEHAVGRTLNPIRVAIDVDCGFEVAGRVLGARRSALRSPDQVAALAAEAVRRPSLRLVGLMFYDAQIAVVRDTVATRVMKKKSAAELVQRRAEIRSAVEAIAPLEIVNAGGTGSLHLYRDDPTVTDVAAGSGLYQPALFDDYDVPTGSAALQPAAFIGCPVVRRPSPEVVVVSAGGYLASGPAGADRVPVPVVPPRLKYLPDEGAGEVQTPLQGAAAKAMQLGDAVWFRHAKAGEVAERFTEVSLMSRGEVVATLPTYRGEGRCYG